MARLVFDETGLLPHLNPGVTNRAELLALRRVSVSQGLMLESAASRLGAKGGPHHGSPDKHPAARLACIAAAGPLRVPFTSGILIGIGETRRERIEALLALRELHEADGHLQEIIIQNFRHKPGTRMSAAAEPLLADLLWTIAVARIVFAPDMNIQAPPNLSPGEVPRLIAAGINDLGGISPVTIDHVNPEATWPALAALAAEVEETGRNLVPRLPIYPRHLHDAEVWLDADLRAAVLRCSDASGYARNESWAPGSTEPPPVLAGKPPAGRSAATAVIDRAMAGRRLDEHEIVALFESLGGGVLEVCEAANELRREVCGDTVTYVVNRNINYTNICGYRCGFCAFAKGQVGNGRRERGHDMSLTEIQRRTREAWQHGATEVCLQGGIHPEYTGDTYLAIVEAVRKAQPRIHVHAFSPLEITQGAGTLGLSIDEFLRELKAAGLGSLPGTAAEILDDEVRAVICPDKLSTRQWLDVVRTAHRLGLRTTATIMFGHVDRPMHWARHLLRLRDLQEETGGFTEFVPLPYVHMEAPLYRRGRSRSGPTFRETLLMHAVARLVLHPLIPNIQTSWVKLGAAGVRRCLDAGVNDLGGTLMNESISRAAGAGHGQMFAAADLRDLIAGCGRLPVQRTTLYDPAPLAVA